MKESKRKRGRPQKGEFPEKDKQMQEAKHAVTQLFATISSSSGPRALAAQPLGLDDEHQLCPNFPRQKHHT